MNDFDIVILGCGWSGVLVAEIFGSSNTLCIDKELNLGGLLRSDYINGFTIDIGGSHVIFSKDEGVLSKMIGFLGNNVVARERSAYVNLHEVLVPYPLENGLYVLPLEERAEALISFIEVLLSIDKDWRPKNLEEWIKGFFGNWFAKKYLIPYNRKIWKRPLNEIDVDWVYTPGRLPIPDWRDVVRSAVGIPTVGYREQSKFYYPLRGGIQALYNSVYERAQSKGVIFVRGTRITSIKISEEGKGFLVNGQYYAKKLVNTIPLPELIEAVEGNAYEDLKQFSKYFDYNRVVVVAVAVNRQAPPNQHWIYVPDENIVFHRYAWLSNYSPYNAPEERGLLITEITVPPNAIVSPDIVEQVIEGLQRLNVIDEREVIFTKMYVNEYGYPVHKTGLEQAREALLDHLIKSSIISIGRWGSWRYMNMDSIVKQVENVKNLIRQH